RLVVRSNDRGDAYFGKGVTRLPVLRIGHRCDAQRFESLTVHDGILERSVAADDGVLIFVSMSLRSVDGASVPAGATAGNDFRLFIPEVDQRKTTVTADDVEITTRMRRTQNMHRFARIDDGDLLMRRSV